MYWLVYQAGSFALKERYASPSEAENRLAELQEPFSLAKVIPDDTSDPGLRRWLAFCAELK
jgi:hypothetical protein